MYKASQFSKEEVNTLLGDAWMNVNFKDIKFWNPLLHIPPCSSDNPELYITWLMSQPEYFSFVCKEIFNFPIYPLQGLILQQLWGHRFPMLIGSRGLGKSSTLALYILLRLLLLPGRKVVITGASFRQSKVIFEYMERIWNDAPLLRDICGGASQQGPMHSADVWTFRIGNSVAKALPMGDGEKIRGQRANDVIADEFASVARSIFETVVMGFAAVNASPFEAMRSAAAIKLARQLGIKLPKVSEYEKMKDNQIVISGTAYYSFNHFHEYFNTYKQIIYSGGKQDSLAKVLGKDRFKAVNWKDYCIMRIPYEMIPEGFMDSQVIARAKATIADSIYQMEYGCVFTKDSNGFFKRSIIENCVANEQAQIKVGNETIVYSPMITGNSNKKYVIAIDPAAEHDNFAIVVVELHEEHRRIVYCWTTNKKEHREKLKAGYTADTNYYSYCADKIRQLMKAFPCAGIAIDAQGGGNSVIEALHDKDKVPEGEPLIWEILNPEKPLMTDHEEGLHIIEKIEFSSAAWVSAANHGLRDALSNRHILFPAVDAIDVVLAMSENQDNIYDTLEDCIFEIEELKNELSTIVMTASPTGKDRWDTPEIKTDGKKGRMRKDRYSALLMANYLAQKLQTTEERPAYQPSAGWANYSFAKRKDGDSGNLYSGPKNIVKLLQNLY